MEKEIDIDFAKEKIYENVLQCGIKCFVIPKKGYAEKQAVVAVDYGSADNRFICGEKEYDMPVGMAHFLEHKLFEQQDYNVFNEFSKAGANANAFTNFNTTAYYFNCIENFERNFQILLDFVSKPYFTEDNVKKEKGIITQEINMYEDDPSWQIYFNMLDLMYHNHNVKYNIAGTEKSIGKINSDMLYECYNSFYNCGNAVIVCVGDFDRKAVYETAENFLKLKEKANIKKVHGSEPDSVKNNFTEKSMSVDRKMFNLGIKDINFQNDIIGKICTTKIILDIIAGESSELFEELYNKGIIDNSFSYDYTCGRDYGFAIISGYSENPEAVRDAFFQKVAYLKKNGINESVFEKIKNKHIGRFIRSFNSIDGIASVQVDFFTKGINLYDYAKCYGSINIGDAEKRLNEFFDENRAVMSLIVP